MLRVTWTTVLTLSLVLVAIAWAPSAASARADKVGLCHLDDDGVFHLISVSERALPAHVGHGDARPGGAVPGMDGYVFDEACNVQDVTPPEPIEPGCYVSGTGFNDILYEGPIGSAPNVAFLDSFDGDCDGQPYGGPMALVVAEDIASAMEACVAFGYVEALGEPLNGATYGYTGLPANTWLCMQF
jgi:hypothetical protein